MASDKAMDDKVTDVDLIRCFDAKIWAGEFCKRNKAVNEPTMLGWFANAIMAGYDYARRQAQEAPRGYDLENQKAENLGSWRLPLEEQEAPKAGECRYKLIGDYGCYPRVAYRSECGFSLIVLEGYDIGTSGERLNTLRFPSKTCAKCGKEIVISRLKPAAVQAQEAPKADPCIGCHLCENGFSSTCAKKKIYDMRQEAASGQSAEELAIKIMRFGQEAYKTDARKEVTMVEAIDSSTAWIEADRVAQRQIGREERQHEVDLAELEADRVKIEWEHDLERYAELVAAAREARAWIDGILCQCDTTVDHVCDRCVLIRSIDKALSALDEAKGESR